MGAEDLPALRRTHLLRPATGDPTVIVHVAPVGTPLPTSPVPLLLLAADLADHHGPREMAQARTLIAQGLA